MKKDPRNSYLLPIIIGAVFLVPLVILTLTELGYIGMDDAVSLLDGTSHILYIIGGILAVIIIIGAVLKSYRILKRRDGKGFGQKIIIIFLAFLALFLRFNRMFGWF